MILSSLEKNRIDLIPEGTPRPLYKTKGEYASIDVTDKLDLMHDIRTNYQNMDNDFFELFGLNRSNLELPMPTVSTYHRPLATLPKPVRNVLHDAFSDTQNFRNKLANDRINVSTRNPSHAFLLYDDWRVTQAGQKEVTRTYMGIGELNGQGRPTGDKGAGIGGVQIKGKVYKVYGDTYGIEWGTHTDSGYTTAEVINLYTTLFGRRPNEELTVLNVWDEVINGIEHKIQTSSMLNETALPDIHKTRSLRAWLDSPPPFNYNLLNNNCQNFVEDMVGYLTGRGLPQRWDLNSQLMLQQGRVDSFINSVEIIDPTLTAKLSSIRLFAKGIARQSVPKSNKRKMLRIKFRNMA
jgi:hypothetical protein